MNEPTPFLQSWIIDIILLFGGVIIGLFIGGLNKASSQASRVKEMWEELLKESLRQPFEAGGFIDPSPIKEGKPDR